MQLRDKINNDVFYYYLVNKHQGLNYVILIKRFLRHPVPRLQLQWGKKKTIYTPITWIFKYDLENLEPVPLLLGDPDYASYPKTVYLRT